MSVGAESSEARWLVALRRELGKINRVTGEQSRRPRTRSFAFRERNLGSEAANLRARLGPAWARVGCCAL
jgi:hypothetical protein